MITNTERTIIHRRRTIASPAVNGYDAAIELLRKLEKLNHDHERPARSADVVQDSLASLANWPRAEQKRFSRVMSDWLVTELMGCGMNISEYVARVEKRAPIAR